ncbi:MAG: hypothetical protein JNG83_10975 [Opitutaceae bacterium]|nr:hypothetical protein [Opitutaceae bacterium]
MQQDAVDGLGKGAVRDDNTFFACEPYWIDEAFAKTPDCQVLSESGDVIAFAGCVTLFAMP